MSKKALITGITGQDGAYLAQLLLEKGYQVYGTYRRTSSLNFWRLEALGLNMHPRLHLVEYDVTDLGAAIRILTTTEVTEVYNLAAQSYVAVSFEQPRTTTEISGMGALNLLEAIRCVNPTIRFYQASTSEMFGKAPNTPQNESTPFYPRSPYGIAKVYAHWMTINYRESYHLFAASGILFNHESPLRGLEFVTRKITDGLVKVKLGQQDCLLLGNLDAKRDWGYAKEFVDGIWRMLQTDTPDTFVLATNETHSVRDFVNLVASKLDLALEWRGSGVDEVGVDKKSGRCIVRVNTKLYRPAEVDILQGDATKAIRELGWRHQTDIQQLCSLMVEADLARNQQLLCAM